MQRILFGMETVSLLIRELAIEKLFVVHGKAYSVLRHQLNGSVPCVAFSGFEANPQFDDVRKAVALFRESRCDAILAVGGGSAIDIAKCVKLFSRIESGDVLNADNYVDTGIPLIAVPSTAGTGSESTKFAVLYADGEKHSVEHSSILPNAAVLDARLLKDLPSYYKKCTFLDALCQAIEARWSIHATDESCGYSTIAMHLLRSAQANYFAGDENAASVVLLGANYAGRAINIARTTAAHALSYRLTSEYSLPHGHAVAICLPAVWALMSDCRELNPVFEEISAALGFGTTEEAIAGFGEMLLEMGIVPPTCSLDLDLLVRTVNIKRLNNSPVRLNQEDIRQIYQSLSGRK